MASQPKCVFLTVVFTLVIASGQAVGICDVCQCDRRQGEVKSVVCDCNSQNKVLNITEDKMADVAHVTDFGVSNCTAVNFHKSAFKNAHDLRKVTVSRVGSVTINLGVFSSLTSLLVEDVSDLRFAKMAFLGATVEDITVHRCNISVLHDLVFYDVVGLRKLEFGGVVIGHIKTAAVKVDMTDDSEVIINGCEVGMVESGAVYLQTSRLSITKSLFERIRYQAVNVTASQSIRVMKNFFSANCSSHGLTVTSKTINVEQNTFSYLPIGLLRRTQGAASVVTFTKNVVYNFTLMSEGVDLSTMLYLDDFRDNEILCSCDIAKSVLAYKVFQSASAPRTIVAQNYCHLEASSTCRLSLQRLSEEQLQVCHGETTTDLDEFCRNLPTSTSATVTQDTRRGRAEGPPPGTEVPPPSTESSTTSTTTTITTTSGGHEAAPHHTHSAGTAFSFSAVLAVLAVIAYCHTTHYEL